MAWIQRNAHQESRGVIAEVGFCRWLFVAPECTNGLLKWNHALNEPRRLKIAPSHTQENQGLWTDRSKYTALIGAVTKNTLTFERITSGRGGWCTGRWTRGCGRRRVIQSHLCSRRRQRIWHILEAKCLLEGNRKYRCFYAQGEAMLMKRNV